MYRLHVASWAMDQPLRLDTLEPDLQIISFKCLVQGQRVRWTCVPTEGGVSTAVERGKLLE